MVCLVTIELRSAWWRSRVATTPLYACVVVIALSGIAMAGTRMPEGDPAPPPRGFIWFCVMHTDDCLTRPSTPVHTDAETDAAMETLEKVQTAVNGSIEYADEPLSHWEYPENGSGNCNGFAMEKRRRLLRLGWSARELRLAVAVTETDESHLVLVVSLPSGDVVLDNRQTDVVPWDELPYRWVEAQDPGNPTRWKTITSGRS